MKRPYTPAQLIARVRAVLNETSFLRVGDFDIHQRNDGTYWIEHKSGEGMQTGKALEDAIAAFYKEHF